MPAPVKLRDFVESTWFKLVTRGAMLLAPLLLGWFVGVSYGVQERVEKIEDVQQTRALDGEAFQSFVTGELSDLQALQTKHGDTLDIMRADIAMMRGILTEMQRQNVAQRTAIGDGN